MVKAFHTSNEMLQFSLVIYILFLGIAQLIYGPLSDRYGRKPILLFGCTLFFIASLASIFTHSINQFLLLRAIQGLGIGCGFTVASAILADIFTGKKLAQFTSYSAMVYSSSLIFAPVLGGYLQHYLGWQANLLVMAIYALALCVLIKFLLFETRKITNSPSLSFL
jgi:Arabinose efflux permease